LYGESTTTCPDRLGTTLRKRTSQKKGRFISHSSRTTVEEIRNKWRAKRGGRGGGDDGGGGQASEEGPITLCMEVHPGCMGMGSGSCMEWTFLLACVCSSLVFCGLLFVTGTIVFGVASDQMESWEHFAFLGSFFGVLATCSIVFCIWFLLPRYTERRGPRGVLSDQRQLESLEQETWVWSFGAGKNASFDEPLLHPRTDPFYKTGSGQTSEQT
jgi:hypothetical protein